MCSVLRSFDFSLPSTPSVRYPIEATGTLINNPPRIVGASTHVLVTIS